MAVPRVKICGITSEADALSAAELGASALGFNFYARSPRYIPEERAAAIVRVLPAFVEPVGVFVNELFEHMIAAAGRLGSVRTLQFHGDQLAPCPRAAFRFIPAFAIKDAESFGTITRYLERCAREGQFPAAILLDGHQPGIHGGTGQPAPWHLLADFRPGIPIILAGGLTAENVAEAVRTVKPYAVDVASGVESRPGVKDKEKMRRFVAAVREAGN